MPTESATEEVTGCVPPSAPGVRLRCRWKRRLAASVLALVCGCSSPKPDGAEYLVARLVDAVPPKAAATVSAPDGAAYSLDNVTMSSRTPDRAVIEDDRRSTFPRARRELVHRNGSFALPAGTSVDVEIALPRQYQGCTRLVVEVALTPLGHGPHGEFDQRITAMHHGIGTCRQNGTRLAIAVPVPERLRGQVVDLWVSAGPVQDDQLRQRRFAIARVPTGARLRVSYGVEAAAWWPDAAAAAFRVRAVGEDTPLFEEELDPGREASDRRWFDASIDLGRFAGHPLTLTLETAPTRDASMPTLPVWGDPVLVAAAAPGAPRRRNVIFVSLDTLRARSVGAYGAARPTTPFLDAFAKEGALFEHAIVQAPSTPESHMSFFTSLYPRDHGVTALRASEPSHHHTLAEMLRAAGYATGAVTEDGMLVADAGFERGFDGYRENKSPELLLPQGHVERTFADALAWMTRHRHEPFFLFVHTYEVHDPYSPPAPYRDMFASAEAHGPALSQARYEEETRYVDDQLARWWSEIVALGLADTTILVITSDHGEEFGEHGALLHGAHLYDEVLEVPLIIRAPGLVPPALRITEPVMSLDVLPTVLELLGLPPAAQARGRSLAPAFRDDAERAELLAALRTRPIYAEAWPNARLLVDGPDGDWRTPLFAQRLGRWKLIWRPLADGNGAGGALELYDLDADPSERHPAREPREATGRVELEAFARAAMKGMTDGPIAPDPRTAAKLRALGYID